MLTRLGLAIALLAAPALLSAQELRGLVRDSASRQPIPGAVLLLLDEAGTTLGRNITDGAGQYRLVLSKEMRRVRVVRIGFRPREASIPPAVNGVAQLDIIMSTIPAMLEAVRVRGSPRCPRRADEAQAFALLEQARAGLLAVMVARDANPGTLERLGFRRRLDGSSDRIVRQSVTGEIVNQSAISFSAVRTPKEFLERGFAVDSAGSVIYLGPDADVLLDDDFAQGYCFRVAERDPSRSTFVGLGFSAARHARGRIDIDGTVWMDTVAKSLVSIEYRYVGFERAIEAMNPGGRIEFRAMTNGVVLIDRWVIRMVGADRDTVYDAAARGDVVRSWLYRHESGGELAHARWPNGDVWNASLGTLNLRAVTRDGKPASGVHLRLEDTHYEGLTDVEGRLEISDLVPGPYQVMVVDPRTAVLNLELNTGVRFVAGRDSVVARTMILPTADDTTAKRCVASRRFSVRDSVRILGRVMQSDGTPASDVKIVMALERAGERPNPVATYTTGPDGLFQFCEPGLEIGMAVSITASGRQLNQPLRIVRRITEQLTIIRVPVPTGQSPFPPSRRGSAERDRRETRQGAGVARESP
jgi:hypothetical protein